jgi:MFS transporter, PPP family, 3-phenylpropionic acid transporter
LPAGECQAVIVFWIKIPYEPAMEKNRPPLAQATIMSTQYFLYFGSLGVYLPYFNLYCYHIGLSGLDIGFISGVRSVTFALFPMLWGHIADRVQGRRQIFIFCNFASLAIWTGFFFTTDFWPMLAIICCFGIFNSPIISFLEAATMETLGQQKRRYGSIRVWGSLSFILTVLATGKLTDVFSIRLIVPFIWIGALLQSLFSLGIPKSGAAPTPADSKAVPELLSGRMVTFLFCGFLMLVSHGTYYGFFSIHLEALGCSKSFIGVAWTVAVISEILVMINSDRLFRLLSMERVLFYSFLIAALRWLIVSQVTSPAVLLLSQVLHAATYGTFHMASILYVDRLSPEQSKTMGQAVNNAITYGFGLMVGFLYSGSLYKSAGAGPLFLGSAGIALTGALVFGSLILHKKG